MSDETGKFLGIFRFKMRKVPVSGKFGLPRQQWFNLILPV
jgi:hypothetical protein